MNRSSEAAENADFSTVLRYAQCWEDADIMLAALKVPAGSTVLSIASAGDNTLSLLTCDPARVVAIDLNPAQIAALELRVAAYRTLTHDELLELMGSRVSARRLEIYARARSALSVSARRFWDVRRDAVARGIGGAGRFEHYLETFRTRILPLVHRRGTVDQLLAPRSLTERDQFYDRRWDTARWRMLFRLFFSRPVLGRLGRDPTFFRYASGSVSAHLLARTRHALVTLDPTSNPYVQWILLGHHGDALPHALRPENFATIRERLDRLEWHCAAIETLEDSRVLTCADRANLSNIFEYMSADRHRELLDRLANVLGPGGRMVYWNMMVPRSGAAALPRRIRALNAESARLLAMDKAFFYRALVIEEVIQ